MLIRLHWNLFQIRVSRGRGGPCSSVDETRQSTLSMSVDVETSFFFLFGREKDIGAGDSSSSPFDIPLASNYTGDITAVQQTRRVTKDKSATALILSTVRAGMQMHRKPLQPP